jgi:hypothetical protein
MKNGAAVFLFVAVGAVALAGCGSTASSNSGSMPANYAPYDSEGNPFCGALGTCQPTDSRPYPLRGSTGW